MKLNHAYIPWRTKMFHKVLNLQLVHTKLNLESCLNRRTIFAVTCATTLLLANIEILLYIHLNQCLDYSNACLTCQIQYNMNDFLLTEQGPCLSLIVQSVFNSAEWLNNSDYIQMSIMFLDNRLQHNQ